MEAWVTEAGLGFRDVQGPLDCVAPRGKGLWELQERMGFLGHRACVGRQAWQETRVR